MNVVRATARLSKSLKCSKQACIILLEVATLAEREGEDENNVEKQKFHQFVICNLQ